MFRYAFSQWTYFPESIITAMARLSSMSRNPCEQSYLGQGIEVNFTFLFFFLGLTLFFCFFLLFLLSGSKLWHSYRMDRPLLYNAPAVPMVRKKKRRRCGGGRVQDTN